MATSVYVATRLHPADARALQALSERKGTTLAHELRAAVEAHLRAADLRRRVEAMTDAQLEAALAGFDGLGADRAA
jgi:hypothetical protein